MVINFNMAHSMRFKKVLRLKKAIQSVYCSFAHHSFFERFSGANAQKNNVDF